MIRQNGQRLRVVIRTILFLAVISSPARLRAEPTLSGANYFGDSANAIMDSADVLQIKNIIAGVAVSYPPIDYDKMPRSKYWQDASGNLIIDVPDLNLLKSWAVGSFGDESGVSTPLENGTIFGTSLCLVALLTDI